MSVRHRYSDEARQDLADIRIYLKDHAGPRQAARMLDRIKRRIALLREMPATGTPQPQISADCRFTVEPPYVIYYEFDGGFLWIMRILHGSRDRAAIMRPRPAS